MNHTTKHNYRPDIDGLRAFAIIPVILFHFGFQMFPGGYVGVDVFFTISGFLITSLIVKDITNKQFSYTDFIKRRIRRLLPMAILIYLVVLSLFAFFYPVEYFRDVSATAFASLLFISNIYFWQEGGGYFEKNLEINPLLHTWSLSVEEQFYLVFPFLLIGFYLVARNAKQVLFFTVIIITLSLAIAITYAPTYNSFAAFYLLPPRMYELALGSLIALFVYHYPTHDLRNMKYLQDVGLLMVILPVFIFDKNTQFPSYNALLPCAGAALIMLSKGNNNLSGLLLKSRPAVFLGLISYSLYMLHWPIIVFKNWIARDVAGVFLDILVLAILILLSIITYKYVETPFRNKAVVKDRKLLRTAGICFALVAALSASLYVSGNSFVVDPDGRIDSTFQQAIAAPPNQEKCFDGVRNTGDFHSCLLSKNSTDYDKKIFVWGDSHGNAFMPVLAELSEKHSIGFSNNAGCPPILDMKRTDLSLSCERINNQIFDHISNENYDLIILVGAFNNYLYWGVVGESDAEEGLNPESAQKDFTNLMPKTLEKFEQAGIPFTIVVQPPRMPNNIPEEFLRTESLGEKYSGDGISLSEYKKQVAPFLDSIPDKWHHHLISLDNVYCPEGECMSIREGALLYKDQHHITNTFADYISSHFTPIIEHALSDPGSS